VEGKEENPSQRNEEGAPVSAAECAATVTRRLSYVCLWSRESESETPRETKGGKKGVTFLPVRTLPGLQ